MSESRPVFNESRLFAEVQAFPYPATPDIAASVRRRLGREGYRRPVTPARRLAWALAVAALVAGGLLSVPQVRAAVADMLRIGVINIFLGPTPTPTQLPTGTPGPTPATPVPTAAPSATPMPLASILQLAGETTLAEAQRLSGFRVTLPSYPGDLGPPDHVYLQEQGGAVVVLVWLVPGQPDRVRLSLHLLSPQSWGASKFQPVTVAETSVLGQPAVWTEGPYMMVFRNHDTDAVRLVEGHVLIWTDGGITYRLETDESLEEAVRIAQSLK